VIVIDNLPEVMAQIEKERGVSKQVLMEAIQSALVSACKKVAPNAEDLVVDIDSVTGETHILAKKKVVKKVEDDDTEISLKEALTYGVGVGEGDLLEIEINPPNFGRLAAQTAKQVIMQRIREAEKNNAYTEFIDKVGSIITGSIQRKEYRNYVVDLGRTEAILPFNEQIPREKFELRQKAKFYIMEVKKTPRGPQIILSRSHVNFVKSLFVQEIPEIADGIIEIMALARDAGYRTKIAVKSKDPAVGAVGTCIGHMGNRIQNVLREIGNEKIDVVEWSTNPRVFLSNAIKPAKATYIDYSEEHNYAKIVVPDDQLSIAIGKNGQNVRLASKLCNVQLDVLSLSQDAMKGTGDEKEGRKGTSLEEAIKASVAAEKSKEEGAQSPGVEESGVGESGVEGSDEEIKKEDVETKEEGRGSGVEGQVSEKNVETEESKGKIEEPEEKEKAETEAKEEIPASKKKPEKKGKKKKEK